MYQNTLRILYNALQVIILNVIIIFIMEDKKIITVIKESRIVKVIFIIGTIGLLYLSIVYMYKAYLKRKDYLQQNIYNERYNKLYENKLYLKDVFNNKDKSKEYLKNILTGSSNGENVILIYNSATSTFQEIVDKESWFYKVSKNIDYFIKNYTKLYENK